MISSFFLQAQALAQTRYFADQRCSQRAQTLFQRRIATNHPHLAVVVHTLPNGFRDAGGGSAVDPFLLDVGRGTLYEPAVSGLTGVARQSGVLMMTPELYGVALMGYELL